MGLAAALALGPALAPPAAWAAAADRGLGDVSLVVAGQPRTYSLHRGRLAPRPAPLVIVLHGGGGRGRGIAAMSGFDAVADEGGFVVAYPDGLEKAWSDGRAVRQPRGATMAQDLAFMAALIDQQVAAGAVDPARVYATGISNGAIFANTLGARLAERVAAIAPVAGSLPQDLAPAFAPVHPVAVLQIHGDADRYVPLAGGFVMDEAARGAVLGFEANLALWARANRCPGPLTRSPLAARLPADPTRVERLAYGPGPGGVAVNGLLIHGGGHTWPGGTTPGLLKLLGVGRTSGQLDASRAIWGFFQQHRRVR